MKEPKPLATSAVPNGCVVFVKGVMGMISLDVFGRVTKADLERMAAVILVRASEMRR